MKRQFLSLLFMFIIIYVKAQVDPTTGSFRSVVPIQNYSDKLSRLNINFGFAYNSGNGLRVDEVASNVGTGWQLIGIPKITRVQKGQPDDQIAHTGQTLYPNGYLYNANTNVCSETLSQYPIYGAPGTLYEMSNITTADTELDKFVLEVNGKSIEFILDKKKFAQNGEKTTISTDDNRFKINFVTGSVETACRTTISEFEVIDEDGIYYKFSERELSKNYKYLPADGGAQGFEIKSPIEIPIADNPFQVNTWYISKIKDTRANREINFEYNTNQFYYDEVVGLAISWKDFLFNTGFEADGVTPITSSQYQLNRTRLLTSILKKEIKNINLPDQEKIEFNYTTPRKDLPLSTIANFLFSPFTLTSITSYKSNQHRLQKISLTQSYFVKNIIKDPVGVNEIFAARLCLTKIQKFGTADNEFEPPFEFDYYTGNNATEDFVPPYNYFAKDPWGYYNGNYCGVDPAVYDLNVLGYRFYNVNYELNPCTQMQCPFPLPIRLCAKLALNGVVHATETSHEIITGVKSNYARNGLLKQIKNSHNGITIIEYEQNTSADQQYNKAPDINNVGGVHVSKVTQKNINASDDRITNYKYINSDASPSLIGFEQPRFLKSQYVEYEAKVRFLQIDGHCSYHYLYPGMSGEKLIGTSLMEKIWGSYRNYSNNGGFANSNNFLTNLSEFAYSFLLDFATNAIGSCTGSHPSSHGSHYSYSQAPVNYRNKLPEIFKRVEISTTSSNALANGKTILEFTSDQDFPFLIPPNTSKIFNAYTNKPRFIPRLYGLLKKETILDNNSNNPLEISIFSYNSIITSTGDNDSKSCVCDVRHSYSVPDNDFRNNEVNPYYFGESNAENENSNIYMEFYNIHKGRIEKISKTQIVSSSNGNTNTASTVYSYNTKNYLPSVTSTVDSKGKQIENRNYYLEDYNLLNPSNAILNQMKADNRVNIPISTETWQIKSGNIQELLSLSATEFGLTLNGEYKPIKIYGLQIDRPVPQTLIGVFDPNNLVRDPLLIKPIIKLNYDYWSPGPKEIEDIQGNKIKAFLYRYPDGLPIATITNANADDCGYIPNANFTSNTMFFSRWGVFKDSKITFLANLGNKIKVALGQWNGNSWIFNDLNPTVTVNTSNGMVYYEYNIGTNNSYQLQVRNDNSCQMDEFRFYPKNAFMETVTYDIEGKKIRECDINNRNTYYEYDGLGRISKVLDENRSIIKTYEYHFKN